MENSNESLPEMGHLEESFLYTTYLIGSMEKTAEKDDGQSKRASLEHELTLRSVYAINPVKLEIFKVGKDTGSIKEKMRGWIASGCWDKFKEVATKIWKGSSGVLENGNLVNIPGDIEYVTMSDWITCTYQRGDMPCIAKGSKVLMANGTYKNIEEVKMGDYIFGVRKEKGKTCLVKTKVIDTIDQGYKLCTTVSNEYKQSVRATPNHPFLTRNNKTGSTYKAISTIDNAFCVTTGVRDRAFLRGWLAGYLVHDGNCVENWRKHSYTWLTNKKEEIDITLNICKELGVKAHYRLERRNGIQYHMGEISTIIDFYKVKNWIDNPPPTVNFKRGWLAGAIDADGYYEGESIRYTQSKVHGENIAKFIQFLTELSIKYSIQERKPRIMTIGSRVPKGSGEVTICLSKTNAFTLSTQLQYKLDKLTLSIATLNNKIKTSEKLQRLHVYDLTTDSGNFIANGFIVHNCGTFAECGIAMEHNIPIYLITNMPKKELPVSLLQMISVSGGEVFNSEKDYFDYIDREYKLKRKNAS